MTRSDSFLVGLALAYAAPSGALADATTQIGNATVTVGVGTAILTLPDVELTAITNATGASIAKVDNGDDFGEEIGWNLNGAISVPMTGTNGRLKWVTLSGFWANIEDDDRATCTSTGSTFCIYRALVDNLNTSNFELISAGNSTTTRTEREVDHWGLSLESKWLLTAARGGSKGSAFAPARYFALGADFRRIDQELSLLALATSNPAFALTYNEDLETDYYGVYAAWGGDVRPMLLKGQWQRWDLQSSFLLRGGIYYADTDYSGRMFEPSSPPSRFGANLALSNEEAAFIGGLVLETRKQIGARTMLSLKSEYEYYSYVPEVRYNDTDINGGVVFQGLNTGTSLGDDDAFSAKTMLRLTVSLGGHPEPVK